MSSWVCYCIISSVFVSLSSCDLVRVTEIICSPGSTVGVATPEESMGFIAESINRAHKATKNVIPVIENMVCRFSYPVFSPFLSFVSPIQAGAIASIHW